MSTFVFMPLHNKGKGSISISIGKRRKKMLFGGFGLSALVHLYINSGIICNESVMNKVV